MSDRSGHLTTLRGDPVRRRRSAYRRCTSADARFGPVCACGSRKAKQAFTCQSCHSRARGYGLVPLTDQNRRWRQTYLGIVGAVGDADAGAIFLASHLAAAISSAEGELAELVAEQARDDRTFRIGRPWVVSLDGIAYQVAAPMPALEDDRGGFETA